MVGLPHMLRCQLIVSMIDHVRSSVRRALCCQASFLPELLVQTGDLIVFARGVGDRVKVAIVVVLHVRRCDQNGHLGAGLLVQVQRLSLLDHAHLVMFRSDCNDLMSTKLFLAHLIIFTNVLEARDEAGCVMRLELLHACTSVFVRMLLHFVVERGRQL